MSLDQWSQTPASNDLANYFQTGMAPSKVKNAGWDVMADAAAVISNGSMPTSGGTANAQTITNTRAYGALFTGMWAVFVPGFTNTGAMTLQVDGLTAKNVFANGAAALAGQVVSGIPAWCRYDGTQWQLANPQSINGTYTGTGAAGLTTSPTCSIKYVITADGTTCTLTIGTGVTGTSNGTTFTITGGPTVIQPITTQGIPVYVEDNGAGASGCLIMTASSGTLTFGKGSNYGAGGFTSSGTKAFPQVGSTSVTYQLKI